MVVGFAGNKPKAFITLMDHNTITRCRTWEWNFDVLCADPKQGYLVMPLVMAYSFKMAILNGKQAIRIFARQDIVYKFLRLGFRYAGQGFAILKGNWQSFERETIRDKNGRCSYSEEQYIMGIKDEDAPELFRVTKILVQENALLGELQRYDRALNKHIYQTMSEKLRTQGL